MSFAQNLKILRKSRKVRQNILSNVLGYSPNTLSNWEAGIREPNFDTLCALADYFDVTTDQLLGREPLPDINKGSKVKTVKKDQVQRLQESLLDFVERVGKGGATTETEVQVLPAVAQVLLNLGAPSAEITLDGKVVAKAIYKSVSEELERMASSLHY